MQHFDIFVSITLFSLAVSGITCAHEASSYSYETSR